MCLLTKRPLSSYRKISKKWLQIKTLSLAAYSARSGTLYNEKNCEFSFECPREDAQLASGMRQSIFCYCYNSWVNMYQNLELGFSKKRGKLMDGIFLQLVFILSLSNGVLRCREYAGALPSISVWVTGALRVNISHNN